MPLLVEVNLARPNTKTIESRHFTFGLSSSAAPTFPAGGDLNETPLIENRKKKSKFPRGDTRATPEDKRQAVAQRAAGIAERLAAFDANNNN